ncbi:MAG: T9SS type A sorting domain-containing protein [Haliscomenobacter sp.]|nr:T9SS type A sorting domain-containing protein [Haliscomenobacter sp.]
MKPFWTLFFLAAWTPGLWGQDLAVWTFENLTSAVPSLPIPPSFASASIASASASVSGATNIGSPDACNGNESWATNFWPTAGSFQLGNYLIFEVYAKPGYRMEINYFGFSFSRSSSYSATGYTVTYSSDGSVETILTAGSTQSTSCGSYGAPTPIYTKAGGWAVFKIYFYGQHPSGLAATIRVDDILMMGNAPLPVELTQFRGDAHDQGITLHWTTASERENLFFEVERSHDGLTFARIGQVEGVGNSDLPVHYRFLDAYPYPGINYYRLAQTDREGSVHYSQVAAFRSANTYTSGVRVFPNPASSQLSVQLPDGLTREAVLDVISACGVPQFSWAIDPEHRMAFIRLDNLAPGAYLLVVRDRERSWQARVIKAAE